MGFNIAIDGPAGAGKSTIAKTLAKKLNYIYVDTGAMYRAMAFYFITGNYSLQDEPLINEHVEEVEVTLSYENGAQHVLCNGRDVSTEIRQEEVGNGASIVSQYKAVRNHLLQLQRGLAQKADVIMDGRDIGTCILPNAEVKIFLTASVKCRATRRYEELVDKGQEANLEQIEEDIANRDYRDSHRETAPLKKAEDGIVVDSSNLTINQVVDQILSIVKEVKNGNNNC